MSSSPTAPKPARSGARRGPKPKSDAERREHVVMLRLNDAELAELERRRGTEERARWMRARVLGPAGSAARNRVPELNREAWTALGRVGANLNQLARAANEGGGLELPALRAELHALRELLDEVRLQLLGAR